MNTDLLRTAFLIKFCCVQPYIEKYGYQTASRGQEGHKISGSKAEELQDKEQQGSILFCLATTSLVVATVLARLCISVLVHAFPSPRLSHFQIIFSQTALVSFKLFLQPCSGCVGRWTCSELYSSHLQLACLLHLLEAPGYTAYHGHVSSCTCQGSLNIFAVQAMRVPVFSQDCFLRRQASLFLALPYLPCATRYASEQRMLGPDYVKLQFFWFRI